MLEEKRKKILFIDDEKVCHMLLEMLLPTFCTCELLSAKTGKEAIELAEKHQDEIALVFSDILLPDMSGYNIYFELKEMLDLQKIKFYFQSGMPSQDDKKRFFEEENIQILYKPYKQGEIRDIIKNTVCDKLIIEK